MVCVVVWGGVGFCVMVCAVVQCDGVVWNMRVGVCCVVSGVGVGWCYAVRVVVGGVGMVCVVVVVVWCGAGVRVLRLKPSANPRCCACTS